MTMFELLVTTEFHGVNKNLTDQMMQKHVPRYQKWTLTCWGHLCAHCYTITGPPPAYNYGVRLHMRLMLRVRRMEMWICLLNFYHHRLQHHHYQHHHLDPGVAYNYGCALAPTKGQLWMRIMWEGEIWIQTKVAGIYRIQNIKGQRIWFDLLQRYPKQLRWWRIPAYKYQLFSKVLINIYTM